MRLIYRSGRFRNQGHTTFVSGGTLSEADRGRADRLWQAIQKGQTPAGTTGIHRRLASEGREVGEVLVLDHGRRLDAVQDEALRQSLAGVLGGAVARALNEAGRADGDAVAARAMIERALEAALPALENHIPAGAPTAPVPRQHPAPAASRLPRPVFLAGTGLATVLVLGALWAFSGGETPAPGEADPASDPTTEASAASPELRKTIQDFVEACHGPQLDAVVDMLSHAYAGRTLMRSDENGQREPLQQLTAIEAARLASRAATDKDVCSRRGAFWDEIEKVRMSVLVKGPETPSPLDPMLQRLGIDARQFALARVAEAVAKAPPPPDRPPDCSQGLCLPIYDPADVRALDWINEIHAVLANVSDDTEDASVEQFTPITFRQKYSDSLRQAEIQFRGELSLLGERWEGVGHFEILWTCEGQQHRNVCDFPLLAVSGLLQ